MVNWFFLKQQWWAVTCVGLKSKWNPPWIMEQ
jgi:hypothetical protein